MNLIEIVNNVAIPSPYTLTILEFKELDTKELAYVFFMCDHTSPFAVYGVEQRHEEVKLSIYGKSKWTASSKVNAACDKYRKLKETSAVKLLKAARHSIVKLERYFDTVDLTLLDDNGKPIYHAKDLVANLYFCSATPSIFSLVNPPIFETCSNNISPPAIVSGGIILTSNRFA